MAYLVPATYVYGCTQMYCDSEKLETPTCLSTISFEKCTT